MTQLEEIACNIRDELKGINKSLKIIADEMFFKGEIDRSEKLWYNKLYSVSYVQDNKSFKVNIYEATPNLAEQKANLNSAMIKMLFKENDMDITKPFKIEVHENKDYLNKTIDIE